MATTTKTLTNTVINSDVNINNDNKSDNNNNDKDTDYLNFQLGVPAQTIFEQCHMFTGQSRFILTSQANSRQFANKNVSEIFCCYL